MSARLDEKTARRIAKGRLETMQERIRLALPPSNKSSKPNVAARFLDENLRTKFGQWCWFLGRKGRNLLYCIAAPGEQRGWVELYLFHYNLRSVTTNVASLAKISAHATARLLERRRDVDIEKLLFEELDSSSLKSLVSTWQSEFVGELPIATSNGEFRFLVNQDKKLVAVTWVSKNRGIN